MTIDEAIRCSQEATFRLEREGFEDWAKGVKLGIEALKRVKSDRDPAQLSVSRLLPGETEE